MSAWEGSEYRWLIDMWHSMPFSFILIPPTQLCWLNNMAILSEETENPTDNKDSNVWPYQKPQKTHLSFFSVCLLFYFHTCGFLYCIMYKLPPPSGMATFACTGSYCTSWLSVLSCLCPVFVCYSVQMLVMWGNEAGGLWLLPVLLVNLVYTSHNTEYSVTNSILLWQKCILFMFP